MKPASKLSPAPTGSIASTARAGQRTEPDGPQANAPSAPNLTANTGTRCFSAAMAASKLSARVIFFASRSLGRKTSTNFGTSNLQFFQVRAADLNGGRLRYASSQGSKFEI